MKMDGFDVDEAERKACGREKTEFWERAVVPAQHKRSKSASGNNLDVSRGGHLLPTQDFKSPELQSAARHPRAQNPIRECPSNSNTDSASTHRDLLEKDIEQLQLKLQQEKSMRMLLERALGRASSTLSPGHKQFANQTKELITEIELLEEEVANREQHVLSLYRSIFENSVSRPPSEQSSVVTSPAHTKNEARKHPSIISNAFCSSKNFPLRHLHALATINGSGKRNVLPSKTIRHTSFSGKANAHFKTSCSDHNKATEKLPPMEKTSVQRTLKDHLYQCPSKLSEEMVKCMAAVYCWLRSSASGYQEQSRSPLLSRSSTNVVLPRRASGEEREWSCKSMVEILWISTDKNNFSRASYAINNYRLLVEQLERLNLRQMETNAKTAFWINMYNSLVMHAYLAYGIPHSSLRRLALFHKAAYNIGGHVISATAIEQSIFGFRTPRVGKWLETMLSTAFRKKSVEERQCINSNFGLQNSQALVCFALCTGAFSDPVLNVFTASNIKEELEVAKREFLQANIVVKKSKKVLLPKLLERFGKEASIASDDLLKWVAENVDKKLRDSIEKCMDHKTNRKASQIIEWLPYSSRFRYMFSKDLSEKPWWL